MEARARALLSEGEIAEGRFRQAIHHLSRTRVRAELTVAYDTFKAMGVEGFAERTRRELLAAGATVPRRSVETRDDLTAQETQIARLARAGLSNPEIDAQLLISARTVKWHLHKVFTKLVISSRRQLREALFG
jgi:ATP/maltotriose-dependent transcriptional regulator MalT